MTNLQSVKYQENENFHVSDSLSKQKKKQNKTKHTQKQDFNHDLENYGYIILCSRCLCNSQYKLSTTN